MTAALDSIIRRVPGARPRAVEGRFTKVASNQVRTFAPPGHFYSPIPSDADIDRVSAAQGKDVWTIPGIDLQESGQLALLDELSSSRRKSLASQGFVTPFSS